MSSSGLFSGTKILVRVCLNRDPRGAKLAYADSTLQANFKRPVSPRLQNILAPYPKNDTFRQPALCVRGIMAEVRYLGPYSI